MLSSFLMHAGHVSHNNLVRPQVDHPLLVGAVVDWNLSDDLLLFIEEIHKNNTVAIICSKMQNLKQMPALPPKHVPEIAHVSLPAGYLVHHNMA